jgi:hypothetical protein
MQGTYDNPGPECGRPPTRVGPGNQSVQVQEVRLEAESNSEV